MKIKLVELININQILKSIIDDDKLKVDSLLKFKLLSIMKKIEDPIINYEVIRNEKVKEFGKKDKDGNIAINPKDEDAFNKFNKSIKPVLDSEINVSIDKIKAGDIFNKGIKAEYLVVLYPIIEE